MTKAHKTTTFFETTISFLNFTNFEKRQKHANIDYYNRATFIK